MTLDQPSTSARHSAGWVLGLASVGSLIVALDMLVVTTALPTIHRDLSATLSQLEWTVNGFTLSFAVLLMTGSLLGERYGRRRTFATGLGLFAASSAACALAPDVGLLIAARVVQGAGAALVMPTSLSLIGVAYPGDRRPWALGIFSSITGLAVLGGPVVGGAITQAIAWQWIFWINVPICVVALPLVLARIPESTGPQAAPDFGGIALVTGAALGIVWGLVRSGTAGWGSVEVIATLTGGVALVAAFVRWELRARQPMLPLGLFSARAFSAGNAGVFLLFGSLSGAVFFMAQFLQTAEGDSPLGAGLRLLPWTATLFVIAPIVGKQMGRIGERRLAAGGLALQAAGMAWLAIIAKPGLAYGAMVPPLLIAGFGVSTAIPSLQNAVLSAVAPAQIGTASGTFNTIRQLGGVFGVATMAAAFAAAGGYASPHAFVDGLTVALALGAGLSGAGAAASLLLPARRGHALPARNERSSSIVSASPGVLSGR